ncbi:MAG: hypothetical protein ACKVOJ_03045 [Sphingomonadaceae bacterium]
MRKASKNICYRCGQPKTSMEHFPPKAFFPKGGNLQLKTVPSCVAHNSDKSKDDTYILTHICLHAANGDNLPKRVFQHSILPALKRSTGFPNLMNEGAEWLAGCARRYPVDLERFDSWFDGLVHAIFFDRFGFPLSSGTHYLSHTYLSFVSEEPAHQLEVAFARNMTSKFFCDYAAMVSRFEAAKIDEAVYACDILDPGGANASITIAHIFYGMFEVVSWLTRLPPNQLLAAEAQ